MFYLLIVKGLTDCSLNSSWETFTITENGFLLIFICHSISNKKNPYLVGFSQDLLLLIKRGKRIPNAAAVVSQKLESS